MAKLKEPSSTASSEDIGEKVTNRATKKVDDSEDDDKKDSKKEKKSKKKTDSDDTNNGNEIKKRKKEESVRDEDNEKRKKAKTSSRIESKILSVEDIKAKEDPLIDKKKHKYLKKTISHLCLLVFVLAFQSLVLGIAANTFYNGKGHLFMFGMFSIIQLIGAPIGFCAIHAGNRLLLLVCVIFDGIWTILVLILILYYWVISNTRDFNNEIALHVSAIFLLSSSLTLAICCFIMMQKIEMINLSSTPAAEDKEKANKK